MDNPWTGDLDRYLFYCCPECDGRSENKYIFIEHALESHPSAKNAFSDNDAATKLEEFESMDIADENEFDVHIKEEPCAELENVTSEVDLKAIPFVENPLAKEIDTASNQFSEAKCVPVQDLGALKDKGRKFLFVKVEDLEELKCKKCQEYFPSKIFLQKHKQEHHSEVKNSVTKKSKLNTEYKQDNKKGLKKTNFNEKKVKKQCNNDEKYSKQGYQKDELGQWCCRVCDSKYYDFGSLRRHEMTNHNDILKIGIKCDQCKYICREEKTMEAHKATKHKIEFKCDICDYIPDARKGSREYSLKVHMIRKHGEHNMEGTICDKCDVEFPNNTAMIAHLRKTHNILTQDEVKCEVCGNNYGRKQFMYHQRYGHGIYPSGYKCLICDKFLNSEKEEQDHQAEFHSKDLQCDKCKVNFDTNPAFNDHLADCLEDPKSFNCNECNDDYVWHSVNLLQIHWANVHKLHRVICELCGKTVRHKHEYNTHYKKMHLEIKKHQCHHCGQSFKAPLKLSIHLSKEHNEDTYCPTCNYCGKKFKDRKSLKDHVNALHEKTTKYSCTFCDFWSYHPKCLKTHVNVKHLNHKPIPCNFCDKGFVSRRERDKHISSKHPDAMEKILM